MFKKIFRFISCIVFCFNSQMCYGMDVKKQNDTLFQTSMLQYVKEPLVLIDVGCSGGIDSIWLDVFKEKLVAYGIDANVKEVERLVSTNNNSSIHYIDGLLKVDFEATSESNLWSRTSAASSAQVAAKDIKNLSNQEILDNNLHIYAEVSNKVVSFNEFTKNNKIEKVDFIKIDVDGPDYEILNSAKDFIKNSGVLGIVIEVDFEGDRNRFSKVDNLLNFLGFELCELRPRRYDSSHLPGRFEWGMTAQTLEGRIVQADALYLKDPYKEFKRTNKNNYSSQQLIKLALMYDMVSMSSWAAEILVTFKQDFEKTGINVSKMLDALATDSYKKYKFNFQKQLENTDNSVELISYEDYMKEFRDNYKTFFPKWYKDTNISEGNNHKSN